MKLKARTTYLDKAGKTVSIAGLAKHPKVEGQRIFYSIQGNWYAEDGRFCTVRRVKYGEGDYEHVLAPREQMRTIKMEDKRKAARAWWTGVL